MDFTNKNVPRVTSVNLCPSDRQPPSIVFYKMHY